MKIITRKKQDELLKRLTANLIIANGQHMNIESFDKFLDNTMECAYAIGSFDGMNKAHNAFLKHLIRCGCTVLGKMKTENRKVMNIRNVGTV